MIFGRTSYPYGTPYEFYKRTELILKRDNFACQLCGYKARRKKLRTKKKTVRYCGICAEKGFLFEPMLDWKPPKKCPLHKRLKSCRECPHLRKIRVKIPPFTHRLPEGIIITFPQPPFYDGRRHYYVGTEYLLVHHIDGDKCNNYPDNLITLCRSCHMKVHRSRNKEELTEILRKKIERLYSDRAPNS